MNSTVKNTATIDEHETFGILGAASFRDENPAPLDMVYIASEFIDGREDDMWMVQEAFSIIAPGLYSPEKSKSELLAGLRKALNV